MRCVLLGPPGVGKGTVAQILAKEYGVPQIATGDLFREAVAQGTELGLQAQGYMERGELVPDELVLGLLEERLSQPDTQRGFFLDGFPRTLAQAQALEEFLGRRKERLDAVLYLEADDEVVVERLAGRRVCAQCGAIYHLRHHPPRVEGRCDRCGGPLLQREDDRPETVRRRLEVYRRQTQPLVRFYQERSLLRLVGADRGVEEVVAAAKRLLPQELEGHAQERANH